MRAYRWTWSAVAGSAVLLGLVLALAASWKASLILCIAAGLCSAVLSINLRTGDGYESTGPVFRKIGSDVGGAGVLVVIVYGFGAGLGAEVLPLLAGMVITWPPLLARVHHWLNGTEPDPAEGYAEAVPAPTQRAEPDDARTHDPLEQWSTESLCHEWCRTSLQLLRITEPQATAEIAAGRARLLDELERRNPAGITTWLESGAQAFSDPRRFVSDDSANRGRQH